MVFSVNAIDTGPNNFAAFQARAKQLNGTDSPDSNGATHFATSGAGIAVSVFAALVGSLL